jgi:hypothetical protein
MPSKRLTTITATVLIALLWLPGVGSSEEASPSRDELTASSEIADEILPMDEDAQQLARDEDIPVTDAQDDLALQSRVGELQEVLRSSNSFGGMYITYTPYEIVVLADLGHSQVVEAAIQQADFADLEPHIRIVETLLTEGSLLDSVEAIGVALATRKLVTTSDIDIRAGTVVLTTETPSDAELVRSLIAQLELPVPSDRVVVEVGGFLDESSYGGREMNSSLGNCTSGFSIHETGGGDREGITDAAHCPNSGVTESGGIDLNFQEGQWGGSQDVQWFTTPDDADDNKVKDGSGTRPITDATQRSAMVVGENVCHYGRNSGYGCGTIASVNFNPAGFDDHTYNSTFIRVNNDDTESGDSGCPWYFGQDAFGIHKGSTTGNDPVFMAQNYMHALDISVSTS